MQAVLEKQYGEQRAREMVENQSNSVTLTRFDVLDEEKFNSFARMIGKLQAEGRQVESSKKTLGHLMKELDGAQVSENGIGSGDRLPQGYESKVKDAQSGIQDTLKYLMANHESLDKTQQDFLRNQFGASGGEDAIHKLERMSMAELTTAYDALLKLLKQRETVI